jgi:hypothetical protein
VIREIDLIWMDLNHCFRLHPPLPSSDREKRSKFTVGLASIWSSDQAWEDRILHRHSIGIIKLKILMQVHINCLRRSAVDVVAWIQTA